MSLAVIMYDDSDNGHYAKSLFLVGRFRSGSTAIWNVLRNVPGITAYYEPCHDGLIEHLEAQTAADPTHIGITDYWQEYEAVREPLKRYFNRNFAVERLCLAEHDEHPELEAYFRFLLSSGGKDKLVALKLNRVDFRLPWLRARFPDVPVLYVYRNPRDQWVSIIRNQPSPDVDTPDLNSGYDLITWSANLYPYLPRIGSSEISSSYERVYLLSRMSEEIAKVYADCRIDFDSEIQRAPEIGLGKLAGIIGVDPGQVQKLRPLLVERKGERWCDYHDETWFSEIENRCDDYLTGTGILEQIRQGTVFEKSSQAIAPDDASGVIYPLVSEVASCRSALLQTASRLGEELEKVKQDAETGFAERDRNISQKDKEYRQLSEYLDKVVADAGVENAQRDKIIVEQKQYIQSLQKELGKVRTEADAEIAGRDKIVSEQKQYIVSLEAEVDKLRGDADEQILARDAVIEKNIRYIESLETEMEKYKNDSVIEIGARDDMIQAKDRYIEALLAEVDTLQKRQK